MATANPEPTITITRPNRLIAFGRQVNALKLPWLPVFVLLLLVICAVFAPLLAPH